MLTQNSLPSSTEATKSFLSDHGKEEFLCDWKCLKCYSRRRNNYGDDSCYSLNLSAVGSSTISESSTTPFFVYRRRKPQRNTTIYAKTKAGDNICVSAVSNEATTKEKLLDFPQVVEVPPLMLPLQCNRGASDAPFSKSGSITDEDDRQKDVVEDVCYVNDSCSSSKSVKRDLCSATVVVDDTGECSSSGAFLTTEGIRCNNVSERDICISILKREGVLQERMQPSSSSDSSSCLRSCKACDLPETTLKMLICDHCEEAFHVSCCNPRVKKIPGDEWFCYSCLKKKQKILKEATINAFGRSRSATNSALSPIELMLKDTRPHQSNVRVGKDFQAVVPDWSGPILDGVDNMGEPLRINSSDCRCCQDCSASKPSRISSIGNWLQCCAIIDGVGESVNGTICGKWRRAPLFEVQTDEWECFRTFIWDPTHSDCAVPQELDTDQVLKQLKYLEMLRPRLAAKRRKLDHTKRVDSEEPADNVRHTQTT